MAATAPAPTRPLTGFGSGVKAAGSMTAGARGAPGVATASPTAASGSGVSAAGAEACAERSSGEANGLSDMRFLLLVGSMTGEGVAEDAETGAYLVDDAWLFGLGERGDGGGQGVDGARACRRDHYWARLPQHLDRHCVHHVNVDAIDRHDRSLLRHNARQAA